LILAERAHLAEIDRAQQHRLELERELAHLVEQKGAAAGADEGALSAAERAWPNSSLAMSSRGKAPQFTATKGPLATLEPSWSARATRSFPTPDSPSMSTVASEPSRRASIAHMRLVAGDHPTMPR
jgi:regulator of protease activity HflC (stomatin/prohibitin superfamily)